MTFVRCARSRDSGTRVLTMSVADSPSHVVCLTRSSLSSAVAHLICRDRALARIVRAHGLPPLWARRPGFATLSRIILEQQVSLASARALYSRLSKHLQGGWTPAAILRQGTTGLVGQGVTRQKTGYLLALAERIERGELVLPHLGRASDEDAQRQLIACHGVGPWTASVYLLMALRRPDVWPPGDLALQKALSRVLGLERTVTNEEAIACASQWAPYRAVAARILWCGYLGERAALSRGTPSR
jgi:DNA-3-methyladenine glycosylase II